MERNANEIEQAELSEEEIIRALYIFAAQRLSEGASEQQVFEELKDKGVPDDAAIGITQDVCSIRAAARRQSGLKGIGCGFLMLIVGGIITGLTYSGAAGGGYYIVTYGLFLAGVIAILSGLWKLATAR